MRRSTMAGVLLMGSLMQAGAWQPAEAPMMTKWASDVDPERVLPEYPRPQMVRKEWRNLNGLWDYAIRAGRRESPPAVPAKWDGKILVPFCVESALSGVKKALAPKDLLWYRRTFTVPKEWRGKRLLLHFGAVDWRCHVWVNGELVGKHTGGYDPFSFDITGALKGDESQELVVKVFDPTDSHWQPRGKQVLKPRGIWYTAVSGIWQTVWLEPVPESRIDSLVITPDIDRGRITVDVTTSMGGEQTYVEIEMLDAETRDIHHSNPTRAIVELESPVLWSPDNPHLYDIKVKWFRSGKLIDEVRSYVGMRKISVEKDEYGVNRLFLNNEPLFQLGPLDQGWWPDGLYTAPADAALRYDVEITKALGFNMCRKHVKVEPARWYYWCDKLGLMVWQDMPSGDKFVRKGKPDIKRSVESARNFRREWKAEIDYLRNHPSVVVWVPFNEGWGQFKTSGIIDWTREYDPTRLVDGPSGWQDRGSGDMVDMHSYPGPGMFPIEEKRASVLGEYGGLGLPVKDHLWLKNGNWGYRSFDKREQLAERYRLLTDDLKPLVARGLAAAVYTQTTDVEREVNGFMTYDRKVVKFDADELAAMHKPLYDHKTMVSQDRKLRPPAVPLVTHDPYTSCWSMGDQLNGDWPRHWTKRVHAMFGMIRVDGKAMRFMGHSMACRDGIPQKSVDVHATRTIYTFSDGKILLTLTFTSPLLLDDLEILSRPVSYVDFDVVAIDGKSHDVQLHFDASTEWAVNDVKQEVTWKRLNTPGLATMAAGTTAQNVLGSKGDDHRIDWGYLLVSAADRSAGTHMGHLGGAREAFMTGGKLPAKDDDLKPRRANDKWPGLCVCFDLGRVEEESERRQVMIGYDDILSVEFFGERLKAWWRRDGAVTTERMLASAAKERSDILKRCAAFDARLRKAAEDAGGAMYADLCELVYRQSIAAHKLVANGDGTPLFFSKENNSNGSIGTVDVTYPSSPLYLLFNPGLVKGMLDPIFIYSESGKWKKPFPAHDVGTYPLANGQTYPHDMPVEESGNMIILAAAVCRREGNIGYAKKHWDCLTRWAEYLKEKGFDPENQLCTDDFAGRLAHNANLSIKAIMALGCYAQMADGVGEKGVAGEYRRIAEGMVSHWLKAADDGSHYRLTFDRPGTWSQKYNLAWDDVLGLDLFPDEIDRKEVAHYLKVQNPYGVPLDSRRTFTKSDWVLWSASLAKDRDDFEGLVKPIWRYVDMTPQRLPVGDWHETTNGHHKHMYARSVISGYFMQMLKVEMEK